MISHDPMLRSDRSEVLLESGAEHVGAPSTLAGRKRIDLLADILGNTEREPHRGGANRVEARASTTVFKISGPLFGELVGDAGAVVQAHVFDVKVDFPTVDDFHGPLPKVDCCGLAQGSILPSQCCRHDMEDQQNRLAGLAVRGFDGDDLEFDAAIVEGHPLNLELAAGVACTADWVRSHGTHGAGATDTVSACCLSEPQLHSSIVAHNSSYVQQNIATGQRQRLTIMGKADAWLSPSPEPGLSSVSTATNPNSCIETQYRGFDTPLRGCSTTKDPHSPIVE